MHDEQQHDQEREPPPQLHDHQQQQHEQQQQEHEHKLEVVDDLRPDAEDEDDDDGAGGKRRLFRFKPAFDVVLAREVIRCFPWAAGYGRTRSAWMNVAARVQTTLESLKGVAFTRGSALDHAIVKRRVDMLLEAFRKHEMSSLRGSGTPEEFEMRHKLLAILTRVVDEQTLNKGAMREKRVQAALQVAQRSLEELESSVAVLEPTSAGLLSYAAVTMPLMPIAPAPASYSTGVVPQTSLSSSPVLVAASHNEQQNGNTKRSLHTTSAFAPSSLHEVKRPRVEKTAVAMDVALELEEQKLRLEERRVALEEDRLAWEKRKAQQDGQERQALLDVLRAQGSLVTELLVHLRTPKGALDSHDL